MHSNRRRAFGLAVAAAVLAVLATPGCSRRADRGLPDIYVAAVDCVGGNLQLTVGNRGGDLPERWQALAAMSVDSSPQATIDLTQPTRDLHGGIRRGGGSSIYLTAFGVDHVLRVDVDLDYGNQLRESDDANNAREGLYVPTCDLPDLTVTGLSLDGRCRLVVGLKNIGSGNLPAKAWSEEFMDYCGLSVYVDGKDVACVPFLSLNPDHTIQPPGGGAEVATGITVRDGAKVMVIVDSTDNVNEQNELNNRSAATLACKKK